jgi:hypothetical protein
MSGSRSRYGLMVSAFGAVVLIVSVFLPWYEVAVTAPASTGTAAGHRLALVTAHRALHEVNIVLLVLAALAILDALVPLMRADGPLLGIVATAFVLYRMLAPPASLGVVESSLREGAWLALLGSLAVTLGGMWPRSIDIMSPASTPGPAPGALSGLRG